METIKSLIKPIFLGTFKVLTGNLGVGAALVGFLQLFIQWKIASGHTTGGFIGTSFYALGLLLVQAVVALMTFLLLTGSAFEQPEKQKPLSTLLTVSAIWSVIIGIVGSLAVSLFMKILFDVTGVGRLICWVTLAAAAQNFLEFETLVWKSGKPIKN